jgi:hypothetical protein
LREIEEKWQEDSVKDQLVVVEEFGSGTRLETNICLSSSLSRTSIKEWHRPIYSKGWFEAIWAFGKFYDEFRNLGERQRNVLTDWEVTGYYKNDEKRNVTAGTQGWKVIMQGELMAHAGTATS